MRTGGQPFTEPTRTDRASTGTSPRLTGSDRPHRWTVAAAGAALSASLVTGCSASDAPAASAALPSDPVCQSGEAPDSCLDNVRLALQSAFADTADRGEVTLADYERIVGSVVSPARLGGNFSYALLTPPGDGVDDDARVGPMEFRVTVAGARGTWWMCPEDGRVQVSACDQRD